MVQLQKFSELLQSTSLDDAMAEVENAVWQNPSALNHRMALFQILIMNGAWERAFIIQLIFYSYGQHTFSIRCLINSRCC